MPKVLISDALSEAAVEVFRARGVEIDLKVGMSPDELEACIGDYDGLAIRSATKVTPKILEAASKLRVVGRAGIGVDNVDVAAASRQGVIVMNTPFGNAVTTAEHSVALLMSLARRIPGADASTRAGKWEKSKFIGTELCGKTLGVIGAGNIGAIVCDRAKGLKMRVIVYDPYLSQERADVLGVERVSLEELLPRADFITLHVPLTPQTKGILNADSLAKCRKGVRIVNCARGGLVVEADLKAAIESGHVAGAALDVFEEEPARENPLFDLEQVVFTPHLGASTREAQEAVAIQVAEQMSDYLLQGAVTNAVNMPSVGAEEAVKLRPYMTLAKGLGTLMGQVVRSGLSSVEVAYAGEAASLNCKPLTAVALAGLLSPRMESVNMVNAPVIAKDRDVKVVETNTEHCEGYHAMVTLTVTTEKQTRTVSGTVFGDGSARVISLNGIPIEAPFVEHMLYTVNDDKPGYIGALGMLLGDAAVNIASFHLGRQSEGGDAIALIAMDQALPEAVMEKVRALPHVRQAADLSFG